MAKRRGHNDGGVYQRQSDGLWVGSITVGRTKTGGQKRRTFYGRTKDVVRTKLREAQGRALAGTLADPTTLTVGAFLTRWSDVVGGSKRASTRERRATYINDHIIPSLGGVRLAKLNLAALEAWLADLAKTGASPWTRHQSATVLKGALKYAVKTGLIGTNPAAELTLPRLPNKEVEIYDEAQLKQLLAVSRTHRLHALFALAVYSGMRQGELLALRWPAVDTDKATVRVLHTLREEKGKGFLLEEPKSKRSRRTIDLPAVAVAALLEHREALRREGQDVEKGIVFPTKTGNHMGRSNLARQIYKPLLKRCGLPLRKFHSLRHSHASVLLARGRNLREVSERLGHSSPELTLRVYCHLMPGAGKETAKVLDQVFGGRPG